MNDNSEIANILGQVKDNYRLTLSDLLKLLQKRVGNRSTFQLAQDALTDPSAFNKVMRGKEGRSLNHEQIDTLILELVEQKLLPLGNPQDSNQESGLWLMALQCAATADVEIARFERRNPNATEEQLIHARLTLIPALRQLWVDTGGVLPAAPQIEKKSLTCVFILILISFLIVGIAYIFVILDTDTGPDMVVIDQEQVEPEIIITNQGYVIDNGDVTPSIMDKTDFGSALVAGGKVTHTFTISNTGDVNLNLMDTPYITLTTNTHFGVTAYPILGTIKSNDSTTFQITFSPLAAGSFTDTVNILGSDLDENPYTFVISGTGIESK